MEDSWSYVTFSPCMDKEKYFRITFQNISTSIPTFQWYINKISTSVSSATATAFLTTSLNSVPDLTTETLASPFHCIVEKPFSYLAQSNLIRWSLLFVFPKNAYLVKVTAQCCSWFLNWSCGCPAMMFLHLSWIYIWVSVKDHINTFIFLVFAYFDIFFALIKHFPISWLGSIKFMQ